MLMMGRKKTEAVDILLKNSELAAKDVTVEQYMERYDDQIDEIMADLAEVKNIKLFF